MTDNRTGNRMRPIHPGEILREEFLLPLSLSVNALARMLDVPATRLHEIIKERRSVTADTALRLARCLGTTPEFWMRLQADHDLQAVRPNSATITAHVQPLPRRAA